MRRRRTEKGNEYISLSNFNARIVADILIDDGVESQRAMEIETVLKGERSKFTIPAPKFASMSWPAEHIGPEAIVSPGNLMKEHTRTAIQLLSGNIRKRRIYTHTGWREHLGEWVYLHANGAIGADGLVSGIEIQLPQVLNRFRLPAPPNGTELVEAIRCTLRLVELGPDHIMIPLLGAVWRAPLGEADFSLHLAGPSGAFKTEVAALAQQFWGQGLDSRNLPASWSGTANSIEALAFMAKDALFTVDDYAPAATVNDARRLQRDADRLFRAQGNRSGRSRLRPDAQLIPPRPPRGLTLSTGEDVPSGQSLRARLWVLDVTHGDITSEDLSRAQADADAGRYCSMMAAYVRWLAPQFGRVRRELRSEILGLRDGVSVSGSHRRTPEIFANLALGWAYFMTFAERHGALSPEEAVRLHEGVAHALHRAAAAQVHYFATAEATSRYLGLVASVIVCGRAHLANPVGGPPEPPETWGWRHEEGHAIGSTMAEWRPMGDLIGWADGPDVFLEPEVSLAVAQRLARDQGEELTVTQHTLHKLLAARGLLASREGRRGTLTIRRTLSGSRRSVLHLRRSTLMGEEPDQTAQQETPAGFELGRESSSVSPVIADGPTGTNVDR